MEASGSHSSHAHPTHPNRARSLSAGDVENRLLASSAALKKGGPLANGDNRAVTPGAFLPLSHFSSMNAGAHADTGANGKTSFATGLGSHSIEGAAGLAEALRAWP